ncbi:MAG: glycogen synthase GlgA [Thermovirgaceae bacterium]|nr:glycogen synthase GlgA [Thermovirgaceae bacterium]
MFPREAILTDTEARSRLSVLHVTPEMAPLSKVGGLADVAGSLPAALRELGVDARVLTPSWPGVPGRLREIGAGFKAAPLRVCVPLQWRAWCGSVAETEIGGVPVYLLEHPELFENKDIYPGDLGPDTALPFAFLSLAALERVFPDGWKPDIIHVHDWASCLTPAALKWHRYYGLLTEKPATVLTIHNIAHQGPLSLSVLDEWGMTGAAFAMDAMEFYGGVNLLKGGITSADAVTTVSPNYAREILTPEFGEGLEGVLEYRRKRLSGILNGIDTVYWDPRTDPMIPANFGPEEMKGKGVCRAALLAECGWEIEGGPIMVSIGRLVRQKGMDILLKAIEPLFAMGARLVVIGTGEPALEKAFAALAEKRPDEVFFRQAFDERFAHLAYGGGDIFLMPSLFEPCGLSQMISMRYGTVPVVRGVGGLADTVSDADAGPHGTGFMFEEYNGDALASAVGRALEHFGSPRRWSILRKRCMERDFSWSRSARAYISLYDSLAQRGPSTKREGSA